MNSFKAYFKKELIQGIRQHTFLIIFIGLIIFALLDPVMLKMLPQIIGDQLPKEAIQAMEGNMQVAIQNYMKDLTQIGLMFIIFTSSGTLADEKREGRFIFPITKGISFEAVVASKYLVFSISTIFSLFIGFILNYYYANILFDTMPVAFNATQKGFVLLGIYFIFIISVSMFSSAWFKKGIGAGFITLLVHFVLAFTSSYSFSPYRLISKANEFTFHETTTAIIVSLALSCIFLTLTVIKLNRSEFISEK